MRILVTDAANRASLAATRSLGRAGHEVLVGGRFEPGLAHMSRYCRRRLVYPDPAHDDSAFIDYLARVVTDERVDQLLPISDITTALVSDHRDRFPDSCRIALPSGPSLQRATDKMELLKSANRLGIPVPHSVFLEHRDDLPGLIKYLDFPVVIKPRRSRVRSATGWISCSVSYAADTAALKRAVASSPDAAFPLILQEKLIGSGLGIFAYVGEDQTVWFAHRRLREKPPSGGVSVLCESIALPQATKRHAEALLRDLGWRGVAMVEFKQDSRDDVPKLMEINARFWGSLQLAIDAGVDFPRLLVEGATVHEAAAYHVGCRSRWFWGDLDALLLRWFDRSMLLPPGAPSRLQALREFVLGHDARTRFDNPVSGDMRPLVYESAQWMRRVVPGPWSRRAAAGG